MAETEWTRTIKEALESVADQMGFICKKERPFKIGDETYRIDIAFLDKETEKPTAIFEVDRGAYDYFQKTVLGSAFTGIVISHQEKIPFIQIMTKDADGSRARTVINAFQNFFPEAGKQVYVIQEPQRSGDYVYENMQKSLRKKISEILQ